eukprot:scaffold1381_cov386-Prasinococcus_capsulatus_cf.AAC.21
MNCAKTVGTSLHTCHIRRLTPGAHPTYRITSMLPSEVLAADMARSGMTATCTSSSFRLNMELIG